MAAPLAAAAADNGRRIEHDFNGDGFHDVVTLEETGGRFQKLSVYLTAGSPQPLLQYANDQLVTAFSSQPGIGSRLHLAKSGDLIIVTYNEAVGRERWNYQRKFRLVKNRFQLSLLTWHSRDLVTPADRFDCRIDLDAGEADVNGRIAAFTASPGLLQLKDLTDSVLGRPHELCRHAAEGAMYVPLAVHQLFHAFRPRIERALRPNVMLSQVYIHTGDLNGDGREDAVVSFAQISRKSPQLVLKREAAIYLNAGDQMQVSGAWPDTFCGTQITGMAGGRILTEAVSCNAEGQ